MSITLSPLAGAGWQFFDDNGVPLAGGKIYTYLSGTSTPATTYTSSSGATPNTNPIVLDAAGRVAEEVWLTDDVQYRLVLQTALSVQIWLKDNISGFLSSTGRPIIVPSEATPSQTAAGSLVWGTTSQILTSGNGSGRVTFVDTATAQTLTNKRVTPRIQSVSGPASPLAVDAALYDNIFLNSISGPLTISAPTGATSGQRLLFRLLDNGTARALTWDAAYRVVGVTLPTTTTASKTIYVGCIYNAFLSVWDVVAETEQV
jgi:hypothetical protein